MKRLHVLRSALAFAALCACAPAGAETYIVDPLQSYLAWSGRLAFTASGAGTVSTALASAPFGFTVSGAAPMVEQGPGSLRSALSGTLSASVSGGTLTFAGADVTALNSGAWRPGSLAAPSSTSAANLGAQAAIQPQIEVTGGPLVTGVAAALLGFFQPAVEGIAYAAVRDLRLGVVPGGVPLAGGSFALDAVVAQIIAGVLYGAYEAPAANDVRAISLAGTSSPAGGPGAGGTWVETAGVRSLDMALALPERSIEFALTGLPVEGSGAGFGYAARIETGALTLNYTLSGRLVATADVAPVPEPSTYALLLAGCASLWLIGRRRVTRRRRYESC